MRNLLTIALGVIALAAPMHSYANGSLGDWKFVSGVGQRGTPYCGIISAVKNKNVGQNIIIKARPDGLVVDLYKDKWIRPQGSTVRVAFDFVDNQPLVLSAYADGHILDVQIPTDKVALFLLAVAQSAGTQVIFPDLPNEDTWFVGSSGAQNAVRRLVSCQQHFQK